MSGMATIRAATPPACGFGRVALVAREADLGHGGIVGGSPGIF